MDDSVKIVKLGRDTLAAAASQTHRSTSRFLDKWELPRCYPCAAGNRNAPEQLFRSG